MTFAHLAAEATFIAAGALALWSLRRDLKALAAKIRAGEIFDPATRPPEHINCRCRIVPSDQAFRKATDPLARRDRT